jgi:sodium/potassium-transporting ATPase subunit alpha
MDPEKKALSGEDVVEMSQSLPLAGDLRIQFTPAVKPDRSRPSGKEDTLTFIPPSRRSQSVGSITRRPQSITSIPPVLSEKQKARRKREKEEEKKHVDISEHLMAHQDVAERYKTNINMKSPGDSLGLTTQQAEQLLLEHGPNVLTPPKRRHWILKFWDCLKSLFNLLLILAGILEYILLGIDFKDNFQNVSVMSIPPLANDLRVACAFAYLCTSRLTWEPSSLRLPSSMPPSNFTRSKNRRRFWSHSLT